MVVLAILSETERYGYEISKIIKSRHIRFGEHIPLSSIYAILTRLFRRGLLTSRETVQSGRPPRRLYGISPGGRLELESSLLQALLRSDQILGNFELIVTVWPILSNQEREKLLAAYYKYLNEKLVAFKDLAGREINPISAAYYERPLALIRAEVEWLKDFSSRNGIEIMD